MDLSITHIFESLVAKHKNNTLSSDQFFDEVVQKHADYDLFLEQNVALDEEEESDSIEWIRQFESLINNKFPKIKNVEQC